jgi:hypothetical protein
MGMNPSRPACLLVALVALVLTAACVTSCKEGKSPPGDANPALAPVVPPPAAPPAVDAAPKPVDAGPDAADAAPPAPAIVRKTAGPSGVTKGGGGRGGVAALQVTGNQPKAVAETYLRGKVPSLLGCYAESRKRHPGQHGQLNLKLTMNERGAVELAEVMKSTVSDDDGQPCLVEALRRLKFPPPPGGGSSTVTFQLRL